MNTALLLFLSVVAFGGQKLSNRNKAQYPALYEYIDTHEWEAVFAMEPARTELAHLLTSDQRSLLKANLQVRMPIEFTGGYVIVQGLAPGGGSEEAAIVAIAPAGWPGLREHES